MTLAIAGCSTTKDVVTETTASYEREETEDNTESVIDDTTERETESEEKQSDSEEVESTETPTEVEQAETDTSEPKEQEEPTTTEKPSEQATPKEEPTTENEPEVKPEPKEEPTPEPEPEPQIIGYNPNTVVSLAISKCQAGGMITTQDNLANALAEGRITQEEYNEYYPYDGLEASYYSVFVETDLNIASTTSGQPLRSEDAIAKYIADMLLLESSPVFNIVYVGVYNNNGTDFYEFRCLR